MYSSVMQNILLAITLAAGAYGYVSGGYISGGYVFGVSQSNGSTGAISGVITSEGRPLGNITVLLEDGERHFTGIRRVTKQTTTDANGRYRFDGLAPGNYIITPQATGMLLAEERQQYGRKMHQLRAGESAERVDFDLVRGGVITGRVLDPSGRPLMRQMIQLKRLGEQEAKINWISLSPGIMSAYETDDRGVYRIYGVAPGRYLVGAGEGGAGPIRSAGNGRSIYKLTYHPRAATEADARVIEIEPGAVLENIDITMAGAIELRELRGRVLAVENGRPVGGIGLFIERGGLRGTVVGRVRTAADGSFRVGRLRPGAYQVRPDPDHERNLVADPVEVEIGEKDVDGLEVRMRRGSVISGRVELDGVSDPGLRERLSRLSVGASVDTGGSDRGSFGTVKVAADGSFRVGGLKPGRGRLLVFGDESTRGFYLDRVELNGAVVDERIEIGKDAEVAGVRLVVRYGIGSVRGRVNVTGRRVPDGAFIQVRAVRRDNRGSYGIVPVRVAADGSFSLKDLVSGEYEIKAQLGYEIPHLAPRDFIGRTWEAAQTIAIAHGETVEVNLTLDLSPKEVSR